MEIKIYYQDTDCGGVVYYANYLTYFERARTEFLKDNGIDIVDLKKKGIQFVVCRAEVDYKFPGHYAETLVIETSCSKISGASIDLLYEVREKNSGRILVTGRTLMACVGKDMKPVRMPEEIKNLKIG